MKDWEDYLTDELLSSAKKTPPFDAELIWSYEQALEVLEILRSKN